MQFAAFRLQQREEPSALEYSPLEEHPSAVSCLKLLVSVSDWMNWTIHTRCWTGDEGLASS